MNSAALLDKGMKCLTNELGLLGAEQFVYTLLSQPFDYMEWRQENLFEETGVAACSAAADKYCRENPTVI
jgi:hypothetical protein